MSKLYFKYGIQLKHKFNKIYFNFIIEMLNLLFLFLTKLISIHFKNEKI